MKFNFETPDRALNKSLFDFAFSRREQIERRLNDPAHWQRNENNISCRLVMQRDCDSTDTDTWPELIGWQLDRLTDLMDAIEPLKPEFEALMREHRSAG